MVRARVGFGLRLGLGIRSGLGRRGGDQGDKARIRYKVRVREEGRGSRG